MAEPQLLFEQIDGFEIWWDGEKIQLTSLDWPGNKAIEQNQGDWDTFWDRHLKKFHKAADKATHKWWLLHGSAL